MKTTPNVNDILSVLFDKFPPSLAESFDNCGFLAGHGDAPVSRILVSLDITDAVINEAKAVGAELIVSHHPLIFGGALKAVTDSTPAQRRVLALAEAGIAAISMHTNADAADGGVNDTLASLLGVSDTVPFGGESGCICRVGNISRECGFPDFAVFVRDTLNAPGLRCCDSGRKIKRVAVGGGACGDMIDLAFANGADVFVTADVKYHQFQLARDLGMSLIDAGHYSTENCICLRFADILKAAFPDVHVQLSAANTCLPPLFI